MDDLLDKAARSFSSAKVAAPQSRRTLTLRAANVTAGVVGGAALLGGVTKASASTPPDTDAFMAGYQRRYAKGQANCRSLPSTSAGIEYTYSCQEPIDTRGYDVQEYVVNVCGASTNIWNQTDGPLGCWVNQTVSSVNYPSGCC